MLQETYTDEQGAPDGTQTQKEAHNTWKQEQVTYEEPSFLDANRFRKAKTNMKMNLTRAEKSNRKKVYKKKKKKRKQKKTIQNMKPLLNWVPDNKEYRKCQDSQCFLCLGQLEAVPQGAVPV